MPKANHKIIQINSSSDAGGGSQIMWDIVQGLANDFSFEVLAPEGIFINRYSELGIPIKIFSTGSLCSRIRRIRQLVKSRQFSIIQVHGTRAALWARLAVIGIKERAPLIYTLHGLHIIRRNFFLKWVVLFLEKILNKYTDVLVCVSNADKSLVLQYKLISPKKIKVVRNGIDVERFKLNPEEINRKRQEMVLNEKFVLISVARLHPQKDVFTIIKALKLIIKEIPEVKLLIVGDGPLREEIESKVRKLGLENYVVFLGAREDIPLLINISDIVLFSTNWEALGLVQLEAGASKKAVIASDVLGVQETIRDGDTGFLFKPGSEKELARKVLMLYQSSTLRDKIGNAAFDFVSDYFSKQRMVEGYKKLYQGLI